MDTSKGWLAITIAVAALVISALGTFTDFSAERRAASSDASSDDREAGRVFSEANVIVEEAVELAAEGQRRVLSMQLALAEIPVPKPDNCIYQELLEARQAIAATVADNTETCNKAQSLAADAIKQASRDTPSHPETTTFLRTASAVRVLARACKVATSNTEAALAQLKKIADGCMRTSGSGVSGGG